MTYVGHIDEANRFFVTGWVADTDDWSRSVRVDILVDGQPMGGIVADMPRDGLDKLDPRATGRYVFRYYYADPLSMFSDHRVSVRVSGTDVLLPEPRHPIPAAIPDAEAPAARPSGPVLVTTCGRTGSTAIMAELARHPSIVVAGQRPYEIELGSYYAYALRALSAPGDLVRSLRPDRITGTEHRYHIGFNPHFAHELAPALFRDPGRLGAFVHGRVPPRLARAFRDIILDFYAEVAADQNCGHPLYFAEKSLPERDSRLGVRYMFPNVREIVLIRDLRDIVCSSMATKGADFDMILADAVSAGQMFQAILDTAGDGVLVLKYEEYVQQRDAALGRLFGFLGLGRPGQAEAGLADLFNVHATSESPEASVGRWRRDLSPAQQAACSVLGPFLERLGYRDQVSGAGPSVDRGF